MLTRFWNYQQLLSISTGFANTKRPLKLPFFSIFISILFMLALSLIFGNEGLFFYPIVITLYSVYSIVNSQNKLFEIVPISKLYSLINIYLYVFVTNLYITIATIIALALVSLPSAMGAIHVLNLFAIGRVIGLPLKELMTKFISTLNLNLLSNYWKPMLLTFCIVTIIVCILLPIFFIRLNSLRNKLTILAIVLIPIVLLLFKNTLPVVAELNKVDFWKSIPMMPHYYGLLLILLCICIVMLPISMLISYKLYN